MSGRDWSDIVTSQAMSGATRSWKKQGEVLSQNLCKKHSPGHYLDLGLVASNSEGLHFCCLKPHHLW